MQEEKGIEEEQRKYEETEWKDGLRRLEGE